MTRTKSYTQRLQRRGTVATRRRRVPGWLRGLLRDRRFAAVSTVVAEGGHLAAAVMEWPGSTARGMVHVSAAAVLGLIAVAVYFREPASGTSQHSGPGRVDLGLGIAATVLLPFGWLASVVAGAPLYHAYPLAAAAALSTVELCTAALLATLWPPADRGPLRQ